MHEGDEGYCERGAQKTERPPTILIPREQFMHISFQTVQERRRRSLPQRNQRTTGEASRRFNASIDLPNFFQSPCCMLAGRRRTAFWRCRILAVRLSPAGSPSGAVSTGAGTGWGCERLLCRRLCCGVPNKADSASSSVGSITTLSPATAITRLSCGKLAPCAVRYSGTT